MGKLDALWAYQQAEQQKAQVEAAIRSTPARQRFNKLHKLLKTQQEIIAKLTTDMEARSSQLAKLSERAEKLNERMDIEMSEFDTIRGDEESTAEEMTELRVDIEKLNREITGAIREVKALEADIVKAEEEYQQTRLTAGKAKKEYDQLRVVCEQERAASAGELKACDDDLENLAKAVEPGLLSRYNQVKQHHPLPMAKVVNAKCSGCNMSLPMVVLKKIATADTLVECENCGRILFAEKD